MTRLHVTRRDGEQIEIEAKNDQSLMQALRAGGVHEILAMCGGCCSCATCHVYVDDGSTKPLPPRSKDETDLLDSSDWFTDASRLSCQIRVSEALDGLRVVVAPED